MVDINEEYFWCLLPVLFGLGLDLYDGTTFSVVWFGVWGLEDRASLQSEYSLVCSLQLGMKTDRVRTDITHIIFVFIFLFGFGFGHG